MRWPAVACLLFLGALITSSDAKPGTGDRNVRELKISDNIGTGQCPKDKYRCDQGHKCISLGWICDGVSDCADKRDERNCIPARKATKPSYMTKEELADTLKAVELATKKGDTQADSNSESRDNSKTACPKGTYSCDEGAKCVLLNSLCDKTTDCQDQSDERNCPLLSGRCGPQKFHCDDGAKCLPLTWLCDSIDDCNDKRDEHNCPARQRGQSLVRAAEEAAVNAARDAKRAAFEAQKLMASARQAAEKARKALELVEASRR